MPLSIGGGQLPISAFFGTSSSSKRGSKTGNPRISPKRRDPPTHLVDESLEPPKKKLKQKENLTPPKPRKHSARHVGEVPNPVEGSGSRMTTRAARSCSEQLPMSPIVEDTRTNVALGCPRIDLTQSDSDDHAPPTLQTAASVDGAPLTPKHIARKRDLVAADSLPSPPLTDPHARWQKKTRNTQAEPEAELKAGSNHVGSSQEVMEGTRRALTGNLVPGTSRLSVRSDGVGHTLASLDAPARGQTRDKDSSTTLQPQNSRELMPPPPLPLKISIPSSMPTPPTFHSGKPRSSGWVPSSQTQELSIPGWQDAPSADSAPPMPLERASQIVPSSQSQERELEMPPSPMQRASRHMATLSPLQVEPLHHVGCDVDKELPSPEVIESSQSQIEADITPEWAAAIAARTAEIRRFVCCLLVGLGVHLKF